MKFKSQYYPVIYIVGILVLLITSVLIVANWIIKEHVENQIESKINQFQFYVKSSKNQAIENKINLCKTIANNENLISAIENIDSEAINSIMQTTYDIEDKNNIVIKDNEKNALFKSGIFNKESSVGNMSEKDDYKISLLIIGNKHYLMFTVNVEGMEKSVGKISIGYPFNEILKFEYVKEIQFSILSSNQILNSSSELKQESIVEFLNIHKPIVDAVLVTSQPSEMFSTIFAGAEVYSKILPFNSGVPVVILVSISKSKEFLFLDTLFEYLIYILIVCSLLILTVSLVVVKRNTKLIESFDSETMESKDKPVESELKAEEEIQEPKFQKAEVVKDIKGTVLVSKINYLDEESDDSLKSILSSYQNIQTELINLYDGKVENILNNILIASFAGSEDSINKAVQCSQSIMKLINKEAKLTNSWITIGLNYGPIFYSGSEKSSLYGKTLEIAEAFVQVAKSKQILIQENQTVKTDIDNSGVKSRVWKLKNFKVEFKLVDLGLH